MRPITIRTLEVEEATTKLDRATIALMILCIPNETHHDNNVLLINNNQRRQK